SWMYVVQGPPGPPGQDGRDGRDGVNAPPVPAPRQALNTTTNLDTTALEQSFDRVGQNIVDVLTEQRLTNYKLEQQFSKNNDSLQEQVEAMRDLAEITAKRTYDHMFAAIPIFDGTEPELFGDWIESIETLCEESGRDIRTEVMGRAGPVVQRILKSIPINKKWSIQREELRRCVSDIPTKAHAAKKLQNLKQGPKENLRAFIHKFTTLHYMTTGRLPDQEHDMSHIVQFLSAIRNSKISKRIAEQRIPEDMTLQDLFMKALDLEAGFQMSEGVIQKREAETIMEMTSSNEQEEEIQEMGPRARTNTRGSCYGCGQKGHFYRDCPIGTGNLGPQNPVAEDVVGQIHHTFTTSSDVTNKMMGELYRQLAAAELKSQLYKRGYKKAKATAAQTGTTVAPTVVTGTAPSVMTTQVPATPKYTTAVSNPSLNPVVQLTRTPVDPTSTANYTTVTRAIKIPRGITNAQAFLTSKAPTTAVAGPSTTTTTPTKVTKTGNQGKGDKRSKNSFGPQGSKTKIKPKVEVCQALEVIPEEPEQVQEEQLIDLNVSDSEAEDLCEILAGVQTETEDEAEETENESEF
ncbi:MAG: hypothetical protein MJE68_29420, partial [Proteobacteria bacterium]|nr:hypothetical protein [Pseudomonadota bacterium]